VAALLVRPRLPLIAAGLALGAGLAAYVWMRGGPEADPGPAARSFDGDSAKLQRTAVVPTLDTPLPEGKSAVWCASFQLAWNRLKADVAGGPVEVANAEEATRRLNEAGLTEDDLPPEAFYAAAGFTRDGIQQKIAADMAREFPGVALPELQTPANGAVAFGYLRAEVPFRHPYLPWVGRPTFTDDAGQPAGVTAFGLRRKDEATQHELRRQVDVLFTTHRVSAWEEPSEPEFAVDLCRDSRPSQLILARLRRKPTLAETLADLDERSWQAESEPDFKRRFWSIDTLLVPGMRWRIDHRFTELEGQERPFLNPSLRGLHVDQARQITEFRLDESGAAVESRSSAIVKGDTREFHFDRPFLIVMKKRGAKHPFFAMWVENAELLQR
jgi:hypothetical protein